MVLLAPCNKVTCHSFVLSLPTLADAANHTAVVRKLLKVAELCVEVCGTEDQKRGGQDCALWDTSVVDHSV